MSLSNSRNNQVVESLRKCATVVEQASSRRWDVSLVNGKLLAATVRIEEEWLLFEAELADRASSAELWRLLELNGTLDGAARFALAPRSDAVKARAELAVDDEMEIGLRVHDACEALKLAFRAYKDGGIRVPEGDHGNAVESSSADLSKLCSEAGWSFNKRAEGDLAVELETPGMFFQASIEQRGSGPRASVEIASWQQLSELSRSALGIFLLRSSGVLRLVRPAVVRREADFSLRFDVPLGGAPSSTDLGHALSALSVACSLCAREARSLEDVEVASQYLAAQYFSAARSRGPAQSDS